MNLLDSFCLFTQKAWNSKWFCIYYRSLFGICKLYTPKDTDSFTHSHTCSSTHTRAKFCFLSLTHSKYGWCHLGNSHIAILTDMGRQICFVCVCMCVCVQCAVRVSSAVSERTSVYTWCLPKPSSERRNTVNREQFGCAVSGSVSASQREWLLISVKVCWLRLRLGLSTITTGSEVSRRW